MTAARHLQRLIHVGCKDLGIDADTRHDLQLQLVGKASLSDMTEAELQAVLDGLKQRGFKPAVKAGSKRPLAPRADLRMVHVLWTKLGQAGKLKKPGRAGLNTFIRSRFEATWGSVPIDIDALRDAAKINAVLRALKDWCRREGVPFE